MSGSVSPGSCAVAIWDSLKCWSGRRPLQTRGAWTGNVTSDYRPRIHPPTRKGHLRGRPPLQVRAGSPGLRLHHCLICSFPDTYTLPYPQHQTFSWTLGQDKAFTYRERSHMRFVIDDVGRPLTTAKNTKELVTALRDAIIGALSYPRLVQLSVVLRYVIRS